MAKAAIRDIDHGFNQIRQEIAELKRKEIAVGLQAGKRTKDGKMDMAELGSIQEFGSSVRNIPQRPFMRDTFDEKNRMWHEMAWKLIGLVVDGKETAKGTMDVLGSQMQGDVQRKIVQGPFVPNAPYTVFKKLSKSRHKIFREAARYINDGQRKNMGKRLDKISGLEGATTPLIDSGRMRQSIRYVIRRRGSGKV